MDTRSRASQGYFKGERMELEMRYAYRPAFVPLLLQYLGAVPGIEKVLEVGCGTGHLARLLAHSLDGIHMIGLDSDPELLEIARQMQSRHGPRGDISWVQADGLQLPFPDDSFDLVTSHRLL